MASTIASLLPEIVDRILGYDDTSHLSLPLWLAGNRSLQDILEHGVSYIELRDSRQLSPSRLPKYLVRMRSLRHLIIDRSDVTRVHRIYDLERTLEVVRGLPQAMESIIFLFQDSPNIFFNPEDETAPPYVSLSAAFPTLRCLMLDPSTVWNSSMTTLLPPSLTDLQLRVQSHAEPLAKTMGAIPDGLQRLNLIMTSDIMTPAQTLIPLVPRTLITLNLRVEQSPGRSFFDSTQNVFGSKELPLFPRTLAFITFRFGQYCQPLKGRAVLDIYIPHEPPTAPFRVDWSPPCESLIPPFISAVELSAIGQDWKIPKALKSLPVHVESLGLRLLLRPVDYKAVRALPRRLTFLQIVVELTSEIKPGDFPASIRTLGIGFNKPLSYSSAALLPPVNDLNIYSFINYDSITYIPRTVTSLRILLQDSKGDAKWPPNLVSLTIRGGAITVFGEGKDPKKAKKVKPAQSRPLPSPGGCIIRTLPFAAFPQMTLTDMDLSTFAIPFTQLLHLPAYLRRLKLDYAVKDEEFDPFGKVALSRARELLKLEPEIDEYDFLALSPEPQVTVFDLLPRSLVELTFVGFEDFPARAWSRLPPKLEILSIPKTSVLPAEALMHMPKKHLKDLFVKVSNFGEEHLKVLPLKAKSLTVYCESITPTLTTDSVRHAPPLLTLRGKNILNSPFATAFRERIALLHQTSNKLDLDALKELQRLP